jgi:hypothetical protein
VLLLWLHVVEVGQPQRFKKRLAVRNYLRISWITPEAEIAPLSGCKSMKDRLIF